MTSDEHEAMMEIGKCLVMLGELKATVEKIKAERDAAVRDAIGYREAMVRMQATHTSEFNKVCNERDGLRTDRDATMALVESNRRAAESWRENFETEQRARVGMQAERDEVLRAKGAVEALRGEVHGLTERLRLRIIERDDALARVESLLVQAEATAKRYELARTAAETDACTARAERDEALRRLNAEVVAEDGRWATPLGHALAERDAARSQWADLRDRLAATESEVVRLTNALAWCGGSADFGEGGRARAGWLDICAPLLGSSSAAPGEAP